MFTASYGVHVVIACFSLQYSVGKQGKRKLNSLDNYLRTKTTFQLLFRRYGVTIRSDAMISPLLVGDSVVDSVVSPCLVVFVTR